MASKPPPLHVPSGLLSSSFEYKSAMYSKKRLQFPIIFLIAHVFVLTEWVLLITWRTLKMQDNAGFCNMLFWHLRKDSCCICFLNDTVYYKNWY